MATLITAAICLPPPIGMMSMVGRKPPKARTFRCLGKEGHHQGVDLSQEAYQPSDSEVAAKKNDIRGLFKEAQQNIMFLNKQRLQAIEELNKANREKQDLLDRIEKLEAEKQSSFGRDNHSVCWQLLHRIDSMILNGTINTAEASDLRSMVMSCKFNVADIFSDILPKSDSEVLAKLRHVSDGRKKNTFHVIHICTEMEPLVDGSLASYVRGLSHALQKKGHFVEVILPKYKCLDLTHVHGLREIEAESYSYFDGQLYGNRIWTGVVHGIGVTFIQPLQYSSFYDRERVSGYADDFERFIYYSRASLDYITKSGKQPDVLHIHNWETSIVGPLFWDIFVNQGLGVTRVLLTCHGFDSQWLEQPDKLTLCGLDPAGLHRADRLQDNSKTHLINVLKGGVVYSNKVIILSSMHSKGRIIRSLSHGLELTLSMHKDKVLVAPYGFDDSSWDPSKDKFLPQNYSMEDIQGKSICRNALQQQMGLANNSSMIIVGSILSEISDNDLDNLKVIVGNTIATRKDVQFIFMTSKMATTSRALELLGQEIKDETVRLVNKYDEVLSHLIMAGSDIILCHSFHDPVLQVPLKALKYGAAPIEISASENRFRYFVDHDQETSKFSQFIKSTFGNMSLSQALDEMRNNPSKWNGKIVDAMSKDFSWDGECYDIHVSAYTAIKNM